MRKKFFREVMPEKPLHFSFVCPKCSFVSHKRTDAFIPGLHILVCQNFQETSEGLISRCDFTTDAIMLNDQKTVVGKSDEAYQGGF